MSFAIWDSNVTDINTLFDNVPFELPYEKNEYVTNEGIYFNISFAFHVCLLKSFLTYYLNYNEFNYFTIEEKDLKAFVGIDRAETVIKSTATFLSNKQIVLGCNSNPQEIYIPQKKTNKFSSIGELMNELRSEYEKLVKNANTLLDVRYFLSYEEIIARYDGRANLMKWIDILCDRGVLVTRNFECKGKFYRACRSGEGDYNHSEEKSFHLLPLIINACGKIEKKEQRFFRINSTYLNKVIANLVYDYPKEDYDFHTFFTKPYSFGPLSYLKNQLDNESDIPIYNAEKISKYCTYDNKAKEFVSINLNEIEGSYPKYFGQNDAVPFTELIAYLSFLKFAKESYGRDYFLNALAVCRDESSYYTHVYYNITTAYNNIITAQNSYFDYKKEQFLRLAAINVNSAKSKLNYTQNEVINFIKGLTPEIVQFKAQERIIKSFVPFETEFIDDILPKLKESVVLEYLLTNIMLFYISNDEKFFKRFVKEYNDNNLFISDFSDFQQMLQTKNGLDSKTIELYNNKYNNIVDYLFDSINNTLQQLKKYRSNNNLEKKKNIIYAINKSKRYINKNKLDNITILYYDILGYKNLENKKNINVIENVQESVTTLIVSRLNGYPIFGKTGSEEYGMIIFDDFKSALNFSQELCKIFSSNKDLSQIAFRFGCSYRRIDICSDNVIQEALLDALQCAKTIVPNIRNSLIISAKTQMEVSEVNMDENFKASSNNGDYYQFVKLKEEDGDKIIKYTNNIDESYKIGIITVLLDEFITMREMLTNAKTAIFPGKGAGHQFTVGTIHAFGGGEHKVVLAQTMGDGNNKAAIRASKLIEHFPNLNVILMVGIAGGTPLIMDDFPPNCEDVINEHVRLGDIVVSNSIVQFDYIKNKFNKIELKGENIPPSAELMQAKQTLDRSNEHPWEKYIMEAIDVLSDKFKRPDVSTDILYDYDGNPIAHPIDDNRNQFPYVFSGKIASSNSVLKNPKKRDQLKRDYKVFAVEMEGAGIADATWENNIGYYVVRGISDYCDSRKNNRWHKYASLVAAAYTRALIEKIPME